MPRRFAFLLVLLFPVIACADFAYPVYTPAQRATQASYVIVGKIVEVEKESLAAEPYPYAAGTSDYKMVTVKIGERLLGASGITQVRVGFAPMNLGPRRGRIELEGLKTEVGTEACFFLVPHSSGDFFVPVPWATPLDVSTKAYAEQLAEVKKVTSVIADPLDALKSKDADARAFAVRILLNRYRSAPYGFGKGEIKQEPIPLEESKLILSAMAEMPWVPDAKGNARSSVWQQLNLTLADGFTAPLAAAGADANKLMDEATLKWLEANKEKYRVKRFVLTRGGK